LSRSRSLFGGIVAVVETDPLPAARRRVGLEVRESTRRATERLMLAHDLEAFAAMAARTR
jgi:hypothetical protein